MKVREGVFNILPYPSPLYVHPNMASIAMCQQEKKKRSDISTPRIFPQFVKVAMSISKTLINHQPNLNRLQIMSPPQLSFTKFGYASLLL
jgi:hypothetical protein